MRLPNPERSIIDEEKLSVRLYISLTIISFQSHPYKDFESIGNDARFQALMQE